MPDFGLEVMTFPCRRDAAAKPVCSNSLARPANIVPLALDRHQRGALDSGGLDPVATHPQAAFWQIVIVKHPLDGMQIEIRG